MLVQHVKQVKLDILKTLIQISLNRYRTSEVCRVRHTMQAEGLDACCSAESSQMWPMSFMVIPIF